MSVFKKLREFNSAFHLAFYLLLGSILPLNSHFLAIAKEKPLFEFNTQNKTKTKNATLSWQEVWQKIKRQKVAGGTRNFYNSVCLVSPAKLIDPETIAANSLSNSDRSIEIWHQNPIFMFQSKKLKKIALKDEAGFYWERSVKPSQTHFFYDGEPLKRGKTYKLIVFAPFETELYTIKMVDSARYQQIDRELSQILSQSVANNPEEMATIKADYFFQQQMWSDGLWEIYHIADSTPTLKATLNKIDIGGFCE